MKQYVIDALRYPDYEKIKAYLDDALGVPTLDGVYWLPLDPSLYADVQTAHDACAPFLMALELAETRLSGELLVRTHHRVRCDCIQYADERQRNWLMQWMDDLFDKLDIII